MVNADPLTRRVVVPAAGKGSRSGLDFPKTLYRVRGIPILVRILSQVTELDPLPAVIVSPEGLEPIRDALTQLAIQAELIVQQEPLGMGHAVLQFEQSPRYEEADEILVIWGDMVGVRRATLHHLIELHEATESCFSLPSIWRDQCYTLVQRDASRRVVGVLERREVGDALPVSGEADAGVFLFENAPVFEILRHEKNRLMGPTTGEIGFLPVVGLLAQRGHAVHAFSIVGPDEAMGFNRPEDLEA